MASNNISKSCVWRYQEYKSGGAVAIMGTHILRVSRMVGSLTCNSFNHDEQSARVSCVILYRIVFCWTLVYKTGEIFILCHIVRIAGAIILTESQALTYTGQVVVEQVG